MALSMRSIALKPAAAVLLAMAFLTTLLGACTAVEAPTIRARKAHPEKQFLAAPLTGFPLAVLPDQGRRLLAAHTELVEGGAPSVVRLEAGALLNEDPRLQPAVVLLAQVEFVEGNHNSAASLLKPVAAAHPSYVAARLLLGRAGEKIEDVAGAFESYFAIAENSALASDRADTLRGRALEIVENRVEDALRRGRTEDATRDVLLLAQWAPGEVVTLQAARGLAQAVGDREGELQAVRMLEPLLEAGGREPAATDDPAAAAELHELQRRVWRGISELSGAHREILVLRDYHGLAYADIADVLSIPAGTVMSRLHAARKRLRDILDESDGATTPETSTGRATHE